MPLTMVVSISVAGCSEIMVTPRPAKAGASSIVIITWASLLWP